jgi:hypothetical protein
VSGCLVGQAQQLLHDPVHLFVVHDLMLRVREPLTNGRRSPAPAGPAISK